jgi:phosphatidylglycerol:prolipoprotein diacylglycerol transferase
MYPVVNIFGKNIGTYGLLMLVGAVVTFILIAVFVRVKHSKLYKEWANAYIFTLAFAIAGLVLFKPIVLLLRLPWDWNLYSGDSLGEIFSKFFGELVFFGGLLGGLAGLALYCKLFKVELVPLLDLCAATIPFGHAIGRIGCLLGGCCYGEEMSSVSILTVIYPSSTLDLASEYTVPSGVPLLNVPGMESAFLVLLFVVNSVVFLRTNIRGLCTGIYLTAYGIWRFVIEFFRGDSVRGVYFGLSVSQYVSIVLVVVGVVILIKLNKERAGFCDFARDDVG